MTRRGTLLTLAALVAILVAGCASWSTPGASAEQQYLNLLTTVNHSYESVMIQAGRDHRDGKLTDEEIEQVAQAGEKVEKLMVAAKAGLQLWASTGIRDQAALDVALSAVQDAVNELANLWRSLK